MRSVVFRTPPLLALLTVVVILSTALVTHAESPPPSNGFKALFNGRDLTGWHGMAQFDPYKLDNCSLCLPPGQKIQPV